MDALKELKEAVKNNLNVPGLIAELQKDLLLPGLKEAAEKTSTPLDDMAIAALGPLLQNYLNAETKKGWDSLFADHAPLAPQGEVL